jgi:hypothetical protein
MPDPSTIERLRGLILSASELRSMHPEWSAAMIEDYLDILDNFLTIAELLDTEIDKKIEDIATDFTDGSIPFVDSNYLIENNSSLSWDNINEILSVLNLIVSNDITLENLTASRLVATDANKKLVSSPGGVSAWLDGTDLIAVNDDGDGTSSLNDEELEFYIQAIS